MNPSDSLYGEKRFIRLLERPIARLEDLINRLVTPRFNPFYHLGSLAIFLLLVLAGTGVYLTVFYRPGTETAYASVEGISASWLGQLIRSLHRYASDAFMVVILLHALKNLASGRFWGSRWVAWVSGWVMVVLTWFTGVLGFWLVWDQRAQWITESLIDMMKGQVAVTFLTTDIASSTFSAFIIALFLHIFIPLGFAVLLFVHVMRLARARLVSPRWMMAISGAGLALVAIAFPTRSAGPADLGQVIQSARLDLWYLGYLAPVERWGGQAVFLTASLVVGLLAMLPWLARGRHAGPAVVTDSSCTGCSLCSVECPYHAIDMLQREEGDPSGFKLMASVNPSLCTGCGICVGTCATAGIELQKMPTRSVYQDGLLLRVQKQRAGGIAPSVVFTCSRQAGSGGQVFYENGGTAGGQNHTITCVLPCAGMVDPVWTRELLANGVQDISFVTCPYDDCGNREGPHWLSARFLRRKALLSPALRFAESAPAGFGLKDFRLAGPGKADQSQPLEVKDRHKAWPRLPAAAAVLLLLALLALPADLTAGRAVDGQGQVRVVMEHSGVVKTGLSDRGMNLPEHSSVGTAQILGGERYPVDVQVWVDGRLALEDRHTPTGWRKEGKISGLSALRLPAGEHLVEVKLQDDDGGWRVLFQDVIDVQPVVINTLVYDAANDTFIMR